MDVGKVAAPDGIDRWPSGSVETVRTLRRCRPHHHGLASAKRELRWPQEKGQEAQKKAAGTTNPGNSRAPPEQSGPAACGTGSFRAPHRSARRGAAVVGSPAGGRAEWHGGGARPGGAIFGKRSRPVAPRTTWSMRASAMAMSRAMWLAPTFRAPWRRGALGLINPTAGKVDPALVAPPSWCGRTGARRNWMRSTWW